MASLNTATRTKLPSTSSATYARHSSTSGNSTPSTTVAKQNRALVPVPSERRNNNTNPQDSSTHTASTTISDQHRGLCERGQPAVEVVYGLGGRNFLPCLPLQICQYTNMGFHA